MGSPGGGDRPAADTSGTILAANSLEIWPLGKKTDNFSPLCITFLVFVLFFIFKPTVCPRPPPGAQVTVCVLQAAPVWGRPGSGGDSKSLPRGLALGPPHLLRLGSASALAPNRVSRSCL